MNKLPESDYLFEEWLNCEFLCPDIVFKYFNNSNKLIDLRTFLVLNREKILRPEE